MWKQLEVKGQLEIINGKKAPNLVITNANYLHSIYKKWVTGNIWVAGDRIVYAGKEMPALLEGTEIFDAYGKKIVPGYIEPHVHPIQLHNPQTFADYASNLGTTTFISDNLTFFLTLENKDTFSILDQLKELPYSFYWWVRFDSQTPLRTKDELFNEQSIGEWIERSDVLMGGELTGWPKLLAGDPKMFDFIDSAKRKGKKMEGHYPGASEKTLARMKLLGTDGDHEAMTVEEVELRLLHGYAVTLRYSSIRPDLPILLKGIVEKKLDVFDHLMMTTDGATPFFYQDGVMDLCIRIALEAGVKPINAYLMASYNIARYYDIADLHGVIATGRYATLNVLEDEQNPVPTDVLSKGVWVKREGQVAEASPTIDWSVFGQMKLDFTLDDSDFVFDHSVGIEMVNDVITKPYNVTIDVSGNQLSNTHDESFLMLIDRKGEWRVNTLIKGFATNVQGLATSYSNTGDILLVGKDKAEMLYAFNELKRMGGGMILTENKEIVSAIVLPIGGAFSTQPVEELIPQERALKTALKERGYMYSDAIYTFLFLQATHLPYIRITQIGLFDVMNNKIIIPTTERKGK